MAKIVPDEAELSKFTRFRASALFPFSTYGLVALLPPDAELNPDQETV